jgi:hypothetical protein
LKILLDGFSYVTLNLSQEGILMGKMTLKELQVAVLELSSEDKEILIKDLLKSETSMPRNIEEAWVAESRQRYAEIIKGEVETIPSEEVFGKIRKAFKEGRTVSSFL